MLLAYFGEFNFFWRVLWEKYKVSGNYLSVLGMRSSILVLERFSSSWLIGTGTGTSRLIEEPRIEELVLVLVLVLVSAVADPDF